MSKVRVFVPLRKVDQAQRLVYGTITQEILDKSGEMMDYATSKPNFEKWSGEIAKATDGKSLGNVRVMHGPNACGKLTDMAYDDTAMTIDVCAKIVDENEWNKVEEGVYTGFSVGGSYEKKWNETIDGKTVKKYTAMPSEVSLVDNPCVSTAHFTLVKADGVEVEKDFVLWEPTNDMIAEVAQAMAKLAGNETQWASHIDAAREQLKKARGEVDELAEVTTEAQIPAVAIEDAAKIAVETPVQKVTPPGLVQKWTTPDGAQFDKKADAEAHMAKSVVPEVAAVQESLSKLTGALNKNTAETPTPIFEDFGRLAAAIQKFSEPQVEENILRKGMGQVSRFADLLSQFAGLQRSVAAENSREGDTASTIAASIMTDLKSLGDTFIEHAKEEVAEMMTSMDPSLTDCGPYGYGYYYNMAKADNADDLSKDVGEMLDFIKADGDRLEKAGQRNAKADAARLQKAHDAIVEAGASCGDTSVGAEKLAKAAGMVEENEQLKKAMGDMVPQIELLTKQVNDLLAQPMNAPPQLTVMGKAADMIFGSHSDNEPDNVAALEKFIQDDPEGAALRFIKLSQTKGQRFFGRN